MRVQIVKAYGVHLLTSTGVIFAFFSLVNLFESQPRTSMLWMLGALVIDGIDGPIARKLGVEPHHSKLDGDILDLVIDYLTFILIPALFMWNYHLFPESVSTVMTISMLMVGALWSARKDMKTSDKWFNSFPAAWNFLVLSLWLVETPQQFNVVIMVLFMVLCATNIKFLHIFRSKQFRITTVPLTIIMLTAMTAMIVFPGQLHNPIGKIIIVVWFIYYLVLAYWRTWVYDANDGETKQIITN